MKRLLYSLSITMGALAAVVGLARPVLAQTPRPGKVVSISGVTGCDCHAESVSECYCIYS